MSGNDGAKPLVLWWVKRDIRVRDNAALHAALRSADQAGAAVAALYLLDDAIRLHPETSMHHGKMIDQALEDLAVSLSARTIPLLYGACEFSELLESIAAAGWSVVSVHSHEETGTWESYQRDLGLHKSFDGAGIVWREEWRNGVIRTLTDRENRIGIFRRRMAEEILPPPDSLEGPPQRKLLSAINHELADMRYKPGAVVLDLTSAAADPSAGDYARQLTEVLKREVSRFFPDERDAELVNQLAVPDYSPPMGPPDFQSCSETQGINTMESFLAVRGEGYSGGMSSMNSAPEHCSRYSVHLAWGTMSMRQALASSDRRLADLRKNPQPPWGKSLRSQQRRLHWHDHFSQRLEDEPETEFYPINRAYARFSLPDDWQHRFWSWVLGTTGYPYVDACIRRFRRSGYLSFRARAMITSFAIHDLRLPWRLILYPMAQMMADYVPGIHISQLQMQAGLTGINTLRVYNPTKQLIDHDKDCVFVKREVPELAQADPGQIHALPELIVLGYPEAAVDHKRESAQYKAEYFAIKRSDQAKREADRVLQRHGSRLRGRAS